MTGDTRLRVGPVRVESIRHRGRSRGRTYDGNAPSVVDFTVLKVLADTFEAPEGARDSSVGAPQVPQHRMPRTTCAHAPTESDVTILCGFESDGLDSVDSMEAPRERAHWADDDAAGVHSLPLSFTKFEVSLLSIRIIVCGMHTVM